MTPAQVTFFESIALPLASRGWKVAPCYPNDKQVHTKLVPSPLTMRSKDPAQIRAWGQAEANANACLYAVQEEGGLCFVDKDGAVSLVKKYESETGKTFPRTLLVQSSTAANGTPKGHWYFLQTPKTVAAKNISEDATGGLFSFRVNNTYVASIGSIHPTGQAYKIVDDVPVIPMPDDFLEWLQSQVIEKPKKESSDSASSTVDLDSPFIHRQIHPRLVSIAGYYVQNKNISDANELYALLIAKLDKNGCFYEDGVTPFPYDDKKVRQRAENAVSSWKTGEQKRKESQIALTQGVEAKTGMFLSPQVSPVTPTPTVLLVEDAIPDFDDSSITGIYRDIVDAACGGTTMPRQYAFLAAKVYIGALIAGKVTFP